MEKSLAEIHNRALTVLSDLSFEYKTQGTLHTLKDLVSRQMVMKIFEYLEDPVKIQILSKRFYKAIVPHWFSQIKRSRLVIRLTEEMGVS